MKDLSNISNYLKEKKDLKEKYDQLYTELNVKYQIDQYLLLKKYEITFAGWNSQRESIRQYLNEKEDKKVQQIKYKEKELKENRKEPSQIEKVKKDIYAAKEELKHIRALIEILSDFIDKKGLKEAEINGGNLPKNK